MQSLDKIVIEAFQLLGTANKISDNGTAKSHVTHRAGVIVEKVPPFVDGAQREHVYSVRYGVRSTCNTVHSQSVTWR